MIKTITIILCLLTLLIIFIRPVNANAPERSISEYSVDELLTYYSDVYNAPEGELRLVGVCESRLRQITNPNDGGSPSIGIFQYKTPTWAWFSKLLGEELDINSIHDQIKLTAFIFAEYPQYKSHWSCSRITGII